MHAFKGKSGREMHPFLDIEDPMDSCSKRGEEKAQKCCLTASETTLDMCSLDTESLNYLSRSC